MEKISLLYIITTLIMLLRGACVGDQKSEPVYDKQVPKTVVAFAQEPKVESEIAFEDTECNLRKESVDMDMDYGLLMANAMANKDYSHAILYEDIKNLKNQYLGIQDNLNYDDLFLLSKIVEAEAGSSWLTEEHRLLVASVVINRVNSPEYPNTIYDVIYQKGQYAPAGREWFDELIPSEDSVMAAYKILTEGSIAPPDVVYQANFRQGSGIYHSIHDSKLGTTYFCYSSKRNIYE